MTVLIVAAVLIAVGAALLLAALTDVRWHHGVLAFLVSLGGPWDHLKEAAGPAGLHWLGGILGVLLIGIGVVVLFL